MGINFYSRFSAIQATFTSTHRHYGSISFLYLNLFLFLLTYDILSVHLKICVKKALSSTFRTEPCDLQMKTSGTEFLKTSVFIQSLPYKQTDIFNSNLCSKVFWEPSLSHLESKQ